MERCFGFEYSNKHVGSAIYLRASACSCLSVFSSTKNPECPFLCTFLFPYLFTIATISCDISLSFRRVMTLRNVSHPHWTKRNTFVLNILTLPNAQPRPSTTGTVVTGELVVMLDSAGCGTGPKGAA